MWHIFKYFVDFICSLQHSSIPAAWFGEKWPSNGARGKFVASASGKTFMFFPENNDYCLSFESNLSNYRSNEVKRY
jgi:hypothetical protein